MIGVKIALAIENEYEMNHFLATYRSRFHNNVIGDTEKQYNCVIVLVISLGLIYNINIISYKLLREGVVVWNDLYWKSF